MEPLFSEVYIIWKTKEGNLFARILVSLILLRAERNATMCWHLSADLQGEKGLVEQSYPLQRLIGSFPLLSFQK